MKLFGPSTGGTIRGPWEEGGRAPRGGGGVTPPPPAVYGLIHRWGQGTHGDRLPLTRKQELKHTANEHTRAFAALPSREPRPALEGGAALPPPNPPFEGTVQPAPTASVRPPSPSNRFATARTPTAPALQPPVTAAAAALGPSPRPPVPSSAALRRPHRRCCHPMPSPTCRSSSNSLGGGETGPGGGPRHAPDPQPLRSPPPPPARHAPTRPRTPSRPSRPFGGWTPSRRAFFGRGVGGGEGWDPKMAQRIFPLVNSNAHRQNTPKREGAWSLSQLGSHKVIQKPPIPPPKKNTQIG